ncbi:MAG TPA: AarF/UbiB family protein [Thermoanaerobaculia bacterium]|nr:AarF/UbiB family protein [Thermoanaerobaculia bacterium]
MTGARPTEPLRHRRRVHRDGGRDHGRHAERRAEVEAVLAEHGLLAAPSRRAPGRPHGGAGEPAPDLAPRLRRALSSLGPVFAAYGRYLSSRPDLLPPRDCLELAAIPDCSEPAGADELRASLCRELGQPLETVLRELEEEPEESRLLFQVHRARLVTGEAVALRLRRPELDGFLETDLDLLAAVDLPLSVEEGVPVPVEEVAADFRRSLHRLIDLEREAEALEALADRASGAGRAFGPFAAPGLLRVPAVHRRLATPALLVHERLEGTAIEDLAASALADAVARRALAGRLALLWLELALAGEPFPAEARGGALRLLSDGRIALSGGGLVRLRDAARVNLRSYLLAAAGREPAEALVHLLAEMTPGEHALGEERLRLRARQVVPFRDGAWSAGADELAEHLFLQWRVARECGYRPQAHLVAFCRGLATTAQLCRAVALEHDPLRPAIEEVRRHGGMDELRGLVSPAGAAGWGAALEPHARLLFELPQRLDEVLSMLARGETLIRLEVSEPPEAERRRGSLPGLLALALAIVAVAAVTQRLADPALAGVWAERAGALLLLGLGALLLRAIGRLG